MTTKEAIYLLRPYSLPASSSPVLVAIAAFAIEGSATSSRSFWAGVACLLVALLAQCFCNVVNDLADYKKGADLPSRKGFDRIVASGIVSYEAAMRVAVGLGIATAIVGLGVVLLASNWILLLLGALVLVGAVLYSAGPFAWAYNALGEVAVFLFYGLAATMGTYYVATNTLTWNIFFLGSAMGLASVNILLINNYRDAQHDAEVGKRTIAVLFGKELLPKIYSSNILLILLCIAPYYNAYTLLMVIPYFLHKIRLAKQVRVLEGEALNGVLARTAQAVLLLAVTLVAVLLVHKYTATSCLFG